MNTLIEFCCANAEAMVVAFFVWAFTLGVAIMYADRRGYSEGYEDGYGQGGRDGVAQCREQERARTSR